MAKDIETETEQLQKQVDELSDMVELLKRAVASLQVDAPAVPAQPMQQARPTQSVAQCVTARDLHPSAPQTDASRRHLLKLAGGAAVAAVAGAVLLDDARPAAATTNDPMVLGNTMYAANMTRINNGALPAELGNPLSTEKTLFWADNRASGLAVAVGVRGDGGASGTGIDGYGGTGVTGTGSSTGVRGTGGVGVHGIGEFFAVSAVGAGPTSYGLGAIGDRAALILVSGTGSQPPHRTDSHSAGEIDIDANGTTWLCVADGSPGTWRKIGGKNTAGAFHAISPVRAFDSRWTGNTRLSAGTSSKVVSVANAHDLNGAVTTADVVPLGATAITYNLTVTRTSGQGFLSANPGDATAITSSSINWFGENQDIANGLTVALDGSRQIKVFFGGGGSTDFIVDVTGYYY